MRVAPFVCAVALLLCYSKSNAQFDTILHYNVPGISFAKAIDSLSFEIATSNPDDTTEGGDRTALARWSNFWTNRVCNDAPAWEDRMAPATQALTAHMLARQSGDFCNGNGGDWHCLGPFNDYYGVLEHQGRIDCIWVDPIYSNIILAGSNNGGLWKSVDDGYHWYNITDGSNLQSVIPGTMGVSNIAVNPLNSDIIYISLAVNGFAQKSGGYTMGVAYTTDGGTTWQLEDDLNNFMFSGVVGGGMPILAFKPGSDQLYAIYQGKVAVKKHMGYTWQDITPTGSIDPAYNFTDIEFSRQNPDMVLFSTNAHNGTSEIWFWNSGVGHLSWETPFPILDPTILLSNFYQKNGEDGILDMSLSSSDEIYIMLQVHEVIGDTKRQYLMQTSLSTYNLSIRNSDLATYAGGTSSFQHIEVSQSNENIMYITTHDGGNSFFRSSDRGGFFIPMHGNTHADARCVFIYSSTNTPTGLNDVVFGGTDGGVVKKDVGVADFSSITGEGLGITEFYGLSNTEADEDWIVGGAQDNGGFRYMKEDASPWLHPADLDGDNFLVKFARNGSPLAFFDLNHPAIGRFDFSSGIAGTRTNPNDVCNTKSFHQCNNFQRPFYFDQDNNLYAGYRQIWKSDLNTTSWSPAFNVNPLQPDNGDHIDLKICDLVMIEPANDIAYVAYRDNAEHDVVGLSNYDYGKLFVTFNAKAGSPTWTNITPDIVSINAITDIEVDQQEPNRIWVCVGNVNWTFLNAAPEDMQRRVYYSSDYGQHWADISTNLSPLPTGKILYHRGLNKLFLGTDVGVFTCDFSTYNSNATDGDKVNRSVEWECFNNGLPACQVTDMEFNHCAGKLRIATGGRGMWETSIMSNNDFPGESDIITTTPPTPWSGERYQTGSIRVKAGQILTIQNATIHMPRNGEIIVEANAKLIIDNSTITNDCEDCMWYGIEAAGLGTDVWGFAPQTATNCGWVVIKNNSVIEHARSGAMNWIRGHKNETGGMIQAIKSTFLNNHRAVEFESYHNYLWDYNTGTGMLKPNKSYFTDCTFKVDNGYKGNQPFKFECMAWMNDVEGIKFAGCSFVIPQFSNYIGSGNGIISQNAGFSILPYCDFSVNAFCSTPKRSTFAGFRKGLNIDGNISLNHTIDIDQVDFTENCVGVYICAQNSVSVTRCLFNVGNGMSIYNGPNYADACYSNIGIYAKNTNYFTIEENTFNDAQNSRVYSPHGVATYVTEGILIENSGGTNKRVYKNTFNSLNYGCVAYGKNGSTAPTIGYYIPTGLSFECNTFSCYTDIYVTGPEHTTFGIKNSQNSTGGKGNTGFYPAGNVFSGSADIVNKGTSINYWYGTTSGSFPGNSPNVYPLATGTANQCTSNFFYGNPWTSPTRLDIDVSTAFKQGFDASRSNYESTSATYAALFDGGSTTDRLDYLDYIANNISPSLQDAAVYSYLHSYKPYLSKQVLLAAGQNSNLSTSNYVDLLTENPDNLRDTTFYDSLNLVAVSIGSENMTTLHDVAALTTTARTTYEKNISLYSAQMAKNANSIIANFKIDANPDPYGPAYNTDSTSEDYGSDENGNYQFDSLLVWLPLVNQNEANYDLFGYYNYMEMYSEAGSVLSNMSPSTQEETDEWNGYNTLYNNVFGMVHISSTTPLSGGQLSALNGISADISGIKAQVVAKSMENFNSGTLPPIPCLDEGYSTYGAKKAINEDANKQSPEKPVNNLKITNSLKAYPNPASTTVIFNYSISALSKDASLVITNVLGAVVKAFPITENVGSIKWDVHDMVPGVYLYKLNAGGENYAGKIVVAQ